MTDEARPERSAAAGEAEAAPGVEPGAAEVLGSALGAAAKNSALGAVAGGGTPSGDALLRAMGGIRGLAEAVLPGLVFIVVYTIMITVKATDAAVPVSLGASVLVAVVFTVWRVVTKSNASQAIAGLIGVGASAILAIITNKPTNNYLLGLGIDAVYGVAFLVSVVIGWPLIGLVVGYLYGDGTAWKKNRAKYRAMMLASLLWIALFAARLVVQLPLYFANRTVALGITKLVMGIPLYVPLLLVTWLFVRSVYPPKQGAESPSTTSDRSDQR